ncbi:cytidylate kinase [Chthoniobacter flavus Ellin428]|uniref:Cytidylate kinase n=1 Tax=Chthoniobacter flavus Ellin428 TaxID=497964 RepID=B4CW51_9BACT|nr:(d)CMP kinase [Chthoniobacter flavus]EDY21643.1 cytidylate kinase [Chthoniobacter flavus Ellin428]TCO95581.1 cytidylate kinase [Chthoniobacter flavus]
MPDPAAKDHPHIVIAIDGPAASGKSSVARALARKLRYVYVNTGAMYRAVTWLAVDKGVPVVDAGRVQQLLHFTKVECGVEDGQSTILLDDVDPTPHLVDEAVNANVSAIATLPDVRRLLTEKQRAFAYDYDVVMEGRDIGSAVFPETPYKFYVDASPEIRALRRARQGLQDSIAARDKVDSSRRTSPLVIAEDAHVIDSSNLTVEGVVGEIFGRLKQKGLPLGEL